MLDEYPPDWSMAKRRAHQDEWLAGLDTVQRPTLGSAAQRSQEAWLAQSLVTT